jgi:hypothetical protein
MNNPYLGYYDFYENVKTKEYTIPENYEILEKVKAKFENQEFVTKMLSFMVNESS